MRASERIERQEETGRLVLDSILFATDFSPSSEVGLRYALALARHYHSKIYMVPAVAMDFIEAIPDDARQRALQQSRAQALSWVAQVQVSGELHGVRHELPAAEGTQESLSRSLENQAFDLAINGIGCREGQTVLLEPSVEEVIRKSECPVLTMGAQFYGSADGEVKNILYATDFSAESLEASRYALSLAQEFQARLTLLHVVEGLEPTLLDERARIARPYKLWLGKLVPDEARLWCELESAVEFGRPAERILQIAWENHADLVVVGARGLDRLTEPGLNVRKVMCNAWCPVLTVSGALASHKQERFWRAAAAASDSRAQEIFEEAS
ncbi:MAG: universal stress protein [Acidobacteria bacterium]|nr:universal stress protein [Acidobacteriota bacterium]